MQSSTARPLWIIANPVSGGGRGQAAARALADALTQLGHEVQLEFTTIERRGAAIAAAATKGNSAGLVAVGGDGSLNDVLNGLTDPALPLGLLPAGTANVWARAAGLPSEPEAAARVLDTGHCVRTRVATAASEDEERRFLLFIGAGLDARLVRTVEARRRERGGIGGMRQWLWPALRELSRGRSHRPDLAITIDGHTTDDLMHVLVTRVSSYAGVLSLPGGIDIEDDRLHVIGFRRAALWRFAPRIVRSLRRRLRIEDLDFYAATTQPVTVSSRRPEACHVDGDDRGNLPITVRMTDLRVDLIVPKPS